MLQNFNKIAPNAKKLLELGKNLLCRNAHTETKVKVGDIYINYIKSGSGDKSVLLMPGALGTAWTDFQPQIEKLPQVLPDHTIIAWDPPGYGKSIPPKREFGLEFYQEDAKCAIDLMKALNRPKFSIIGWSDGGITGLATAGRYPESIDKLIIWGAGAYVNADEIKACEAIRDVSKWSARMREPMEKVYGVERFAELWGEWIDGATNIFKLKDGDYCRKEVENITAPVFIIHGRKDPMVAAEHIPYLRERLKNHRYYEFPEGKHNIHLRYANEFNKLVAEFLLNKSI